MAYCKTKELFEVEYVYGAFYSGGDIEWTSDGTHFICLCDGKIKLFDLQSGKVLPFCNEKEPNGSVEDEDSVLTFCLSEDNITIVSAHKSGLFKSWKWKDADILPKAWKSIHKGPVSRMALSRDGSTLVSGGSDSSVRVWDLLHNTCLRNLTGLQGVVSVLLILERETSSLVFAAADDSVIRAWDMQTGNLAIQFSGHFSTVTSIVFDESQQHLISCGRDKVVILWDLASGRQRCSLPVYESLEGLVLLPTAPQTPYGPQPESDSILVAAAGEKGIVTIWDLAHARIVFKQSNSMVKTSDGGLGVTKLMYCGANKTLAVVSADQNIILHHAVTFAITNQLVGFSDEILDIALVGVKESHIAVATNSSDIKVYKTENMSCKLLQGHTDIVVSLATSPVNSSVLVSGSKDKSVRVWLVTDTSADCVALAMRHTAAVSAVALPNTKCNFILSAAFDTTIKLWNLPNKLLPDNSESLNVSLTTIAHEKDITAVCVSPNDKFIATGSLDKTAKVWNAEDLSLVGVLRGHRRGVWNVSFSPVDQVVLTCSSDCTLKLWALSDLTCIKTLEGHGSSVMVGRFISRGLQLISVGADGLLKLWSIKTSECVKTFEHHDAKIWALVVSADESRLVTGGGDSQLVVWRDITEDNLARQAADRQQRTLQDQELANLLREDNLLPALKLALTLERPATVLNIVEKVLRSDRDGLLTTIRQLRDDQKQVLLRLATEWNSISKHCYPAQMVISSLINELSDGSVRLEKSALEAIIPYTERHFKRMTQLLQDLHILQYTSNVMKPHT